MTYYRLLALDIDGTLVGPDGLVAPETLDAVAAARAAGVGICVATGRSHAESVGIWRALHLDRPFEPVILVGGAIVAEPDTARTLYQRAIPWPTACEFADALGRAGHVAMALVDRWRHGVDYLVTAGADQDAASRDWFSKMDVRVRRVGRLADGAERQEVLRISAVADPDRARALADELRVPFGEGLTVHAILAPNYGVTIVEAHAAGANKMTALKYVAQQLRVPVRRIAAVGDDINDLPMIRGAALGAAMPEAPKAVRDAADHVAAGGLGAFIRRLVAGEFDPAE